MGGTPASQAPESTVFLPRLSISNTQHKPIHGAGFGLPICEMGLGPETFTPRCWQRAKLGSLLI